MPLWTQLAAVAWLATAATAAIAAPPPTTQPAARPAGDSADLAKQLLADPLNAEAREKLLALRQAQQQAALASYEALVQGLRAYLELGPELAVPALEKAAQSPQAVSLMAALSKPLPKLLSEVQGAAKAAAVGKGKVCPRCGDSAEEDCRSGRCYSSGRVPCDTCKGAGTVQRELPGMGRTSLFICPTCRGPGVVACEVCRGAGVVPCTVCRRNPDEVRTPPVAPADQQEVRKVMDLARWLRGGGIDLYTAAALKPSPK